MTQAILKRIHKGQLPMHFMRTDVVRLKQLRDAGYLKLSFEPVANHNRTAATVTELTLPGQAAIRYFGFGLGTQHRLTCQ